MTIPTYIIYDETSLTIIKRMKWAIAAYSYAEDNGYKCINRTHPANAALLATLEGNTETA